MKRLATGKYHSLCCTINSLSKQYSQYYENVLTTNSLIDMTLYLLVSHRAFLLLEVESGRRGAVDRSPRRVVAAKCWARQCEGGGGRVQV